MIVQDVVHNPAHRRVGVHREDQQHVGEAVQQLPQRQVNLPQRFAPVFPAMRRGQQQPAAREWRNPRDGRDVRQILHRLQCIDHRVAGDENRLLRDPLRQQVALRAGGRRKLQLGEGRGHPAVHLLGEGLIPVVGAQPRLDVSDGNPVVVGGQRADECRVGVTLHQDHLRPQLVQDPVQPGQRAGADVDQRLLRPHDVQIHVRGNSKQPRDLIQHLPVLAGGDHDGGELRAGAQPLHDRRHLHGLRPRPEDCHDGHPPRRRGLAGSQRLGFGQRDHLL